MAWTAPRTWVAGEVVTAALLNTHLRDNLLAIGDGVWTAYTPTLTATTTSPTLGSGSSALGRYARLGNTVKYDYKITFGTSGVVAGSGTYLISLPIAPSTAWSNRFVGTGFCIDTSASGMSPVWVLVNGTASQVVMSFPGTWTGGATASVNHLNTVAWAASDEIHGSLTYEAA